MGGIRYEYRYNLPMFRKKQPIDGQGYISCGVRVEQIGSGQLVKVKVDGLDVILTNFNGEIIAINDTCPHGAASLAQGALSNHKLSCPDHQYCFDIRTGNILWPSDENYRLRQYPTKVVDGIVKLRLKRETNK